MRNRGQVRPSPGRWGRWGRWGRDVRRRRGGPRGRRSAWPCPIPSRDGHRRIPMIEWNEMHLSIRDAMRKFIAAEVVPHIDELEHGGMPPYDILRKMMKTFGIAEMAKARFKAQ